MKMGVMSVILLVSLGIYWTSQISSASLFLPDRDDNHTHDDHVHGLLTVPETTTTQSYDEG